MDVLADKVKCRRVVECQYFVSQWYMRIPVASSPGLIFYVHNETDGRTSSVRPSISFVIVKRPGDEASISAALTHPAIPKLTSKFT